MVSKKDNISESYGGEIALRECTLGCQNQTYQSAIIKCSAQNAEVSADEAFDGTIVVKDANLWYGDFHALKNVSVEIPKHRTTAFIGPSGCGKSTFLKCLNRMNDLVPECKVEGSFRIGNQDIYGKIDVNLLRKNVGMVFQKPNPFPMSVYDNVTYGAKTFGIHKRSELDEIVETSLKQAAMWDELKDRLHQSALGLSGGQQQRLCIARALAQGHFDGRTDLSARSHLHGKNRGAVQGACKKYDDCHRHPQHATGGSYLRPHGILPSRGIGGIRRYRAGIPFARRREDEPICYGQIRLIFKIFAENETNCLDMW